MGNEHYNSQYFECLCFDPAHLIRFVEDKAEKQTSFEILLDDCGDGGFFKRCFSALKYLFGFQIKCEDVFIFDKKSAESFIALLEGKCTERLDEKIDKFIFADNDEHIVEFEYDKEFEIVVANIIFSKASLLERLKKCLRHIRSGLRSRYGMWDSWDADEKNMPKLLCITKRLLE